MLTRTVLQRRLKNEVLFVTFTKKNGDERVMRCTLQESLLPKLEEKYHDDYPNEPIGDGNPYYRCSHCGISDPQINGTIENHAESCEYRIDKESKKRKVNEDTLAVWDLDGQAWRSFIIDSVVEVD